MKNVYFLILMENLKKGENYCFKSNEKCVDN